MRSARYHVHSPCGRSSLQRTANAEASADPTAAILPARNTILIQLLLLRNNAVILVADRLIRFLPPIQIRPICAGELFAVNGINTVVDQYLNTQLDRRRNTRCNLIRCFSHNVFQRLVSFIRIKELIGRGFGLSNEQFPICVVAFYRFADRYVLTE